MKNGLTVSQIEAFALWSRALAGDPGVPADRRRSVLLKLQGRVRAALERLDAEYGAPVG